MADEITMEKLIEDASIMMKKKKSIKKVTIEGEVTSIVIERDDDEIKESEVKIGD